jgi:hypothetical protein
MQLSQVELKHHLRQSHGMSDELLYEASFA